MIFVDTGAWYARYVIDDVDHEAAVRWFSSPPDRLVTTDYIIDELLTLLRVRGHSQIAITVGSVLLSVVACGIEYVTKLDIDRAWVVFSSFADKQWSVTDCVSRAVIERFHITTTCAFDDHFRQFGIVNVVP